MTDTVRQQPDFAAMSIETVVELALADLAKPEIDATWTCADAWLLKQPPSDLLPLCLELAERPPSEARVLAAHLLGQANSYWPEMRESATSRLRHMLETETATDVLNQAGIAVGFWKDEAALPALVQLRSHPSSDVRYGVVLGLSGIEREDAKRYLIELTRDADLDVRDWAVFGLGQQTALDFPELREALVAALEDTHEMVRAEAIDGLAVRQDERAIPALRRELAAVAEDREWHMLWECAEKLKSPLLVPELQAQSDRYNKTNPAPEQLVAAPKACRVGAAKSDSVD
jgi:HEAT repeat protein